MAKKSRRRYPKGFAAIPFTATVNLLTLAADVVVKQNLFSNAFDESFWCSSVKGTWTLRDATPGEQPIEVGLAHSDYSVGEIAEKLVADEANVRGDKIANEQARRQVRRSGSFGMGSEADQVLNDGRDLKTMCKFKLTNGFNLSMWARNRSGGPLTTGSAVQLSGTLYGRWTS